MLSSKIGAKILDNRYLDIVYLPAETDELFLYLIKLYFEDENIGF